VKSLMNCMDNYARTCVIVENCDFGGPFHMLSYSGLIGRGKGLSCGTPSWFLLIMGLLTLPSSLPYVRSLGYKAVSNRHSMEKDVEVEKRWNM
jgi:hypothetical protein